MKFTMKVKGRETLGQNERAKNRVKERERERESKRESEREREERERRERATDRVIKRGEGLWVQV